LYNKILQDQLAALKHQLYNGIIGRTLLAANRSN